MRVFGKEGLMGWAEISVLIVLLSLLLAPFSFLFSLGTDIGNDTIRGLFYLSLVFIALQAFISIVYIMVDLLEKRKKKILSKNIH